MTLKSKNIHILPTDKPSRLFYNVGGALLFTKWDNYNGVYIYITSDEEIKEGDCVTNGLGIMKANLDGQPTMDDYHPWKKIILTTDQDLIKDGIWGIEDGFLEWFVKNPTCEYVELKGYAIILPGESCDCVTKCDACKEEEPKQKTLEEAAKEFANNSAVTNYEEGINVGKYQGFTSGAKWQQERMYSEEEVLEQLNLLYGMKNSLVDTFTDKNDYITMKWFEQFKNK